jgi:UV DNA damage repair endonuclease
MEKETTKEIKKEKQKEKEDKRTKWTPKLGFLTNQTTWKTTKKHARTQFIVA